MIDSGLKLANGHSLKAMASLVWSGACQAVRLGLDTQNKPQVIRQSIAWYMYWCLNKLALEWMHFKIPNMSSDSFSLWKPMFHCLMPVVACVISSYYFRYPIFVKP